MNDHDRRHIDEGTRPDARRRFRSQSDTGLYALKVLLESLRARGVALGASTIVLLGFPQEKGSETRYARTIRETLESNGAHLRILNPLGRDAESTASIDAVLNRANAVVIATDSRAFRLVSRRDFREHGIDIVIPTDLTHEL